MQVIRNDFSPGEMLTNLERMLPRMVAEAGIQHQVASQFLPNAPPRRGVASTSSPSMAGS